MKKISRQLKRARERRQKDQKAKLMKQLQLSDFEYINDDKNITLSTMGPHLVDFINVLGLSSLLKKHVDIDKRKSLYSVCPKKHVLVKRWTLKHANYIKIGIRFYPSLKNSLY